jgi:hypothetical protein
MIEAGSNQHISISYIYYTQYSLVPDHAYFVGSLIRHVYYAQGKSYQPLSCSRLDDSALCYIYCIGRTVYCRKLTILILLEYNVLSF